MDSSQQAQLHLWQNNRSEFTLFLLLFMSFIYYHLLFLLNKLSQSKLLIEKLNYSDIILHLRHLTAEAA